MKKYMLDIKKPSIAAVSNLLLFKQILNRQLISNWDQVDRIKKIQLLWLLVQFWNAEL